VTAPAPGLPCNAATAAYLEAVCTVLATSLGTALRAVYATGSLGFGDYDARRSDVDVLAIVGDRPDPVRVARAAGCLHHDRLPCPANGLDLLLVPESVAHRPGEKPGVALALATGRSWWFETGVDQECAELPLHLEIARRAGIVLLGPAAADLIPPVPEARLSAVMQETLRWHAENLLDPYHDPWGVNSTLNACRAWCFAETGSLRSKAQGGHWVESHHAGRPEVAIALRRRAGPASALPEPRPGAIRALLIEAETRLRLVV